MSRVPFSSVLHYLRKIHAPAEPESDGELLERFVKERDARAFTALVERHGALVWGLCRRVLGPLAEADDAFQATFLVLVRKAGSIGKRESVRSWLYGVAYRVALRARSDRGRRRARELPLGEAPPAPASEELVWRDLRPILDEEIHRLPSKHRLAVILCYLEGKTNDEAAEVLGCPRGSVATYLSRARDRLRQRLTRRGVTLSATALAATLTENATAVPPAALVETTVRTAFLFASGHAAVAGGLSVPAIALADGVLHTMFTSKLSLVAVVLLTLAVVGSGAGALHFGGPAVTKDGVVDRTAVASVDHSLVVGEEVDALAQAPRHDDDPAKYSQLDKAALLRPIRSRLKATIDYDGIEDPKATLLDALDQLRTKYRMTFDVNEVAFKADGVPDVLNQNIAVTPMPKMNGVPLRTVFNKLLSRVAVEGGATYIIRGELIEVTTKRALRKELGIPEAWPLFPLVQASFTKQSLEYSLRELAEASDFNIMLDPRAAQGSKSMVTADFTNVPVDSAVRLLADMADLKSVLVDNVLYVTSKENADRLRAEMDKRVGHEAPVAPLPAATSPGKE